MELTTLPEWNLDQDIEVTYGIDYNANDAYSLYAIIDADYNKVKERFTEKSIAEVCHEIREEFRLNFYGYYTKNKNESAKHDTEESLHQYIENDFEKWDRSEYKPINDYTSMTLNLPDHKILILWSNLPELPYLTDLNSNLLYEFCKKRKEESAHPSIADTISYRQHSIQIYVSSYETLAQGSSDLFLQRLSIIHKFADTYPEFMDGNDMFYSYNLEQLENEELLLSNHTKEYSLSLRNNMLRQHVLDSIEKMLSILGKEVDEDALKSDFITNYFAWQEKKKTDDGTVTVDKCCHELSHLQANKGGKIGSKTKERLSTSVFYGIVAAFELSPIYAEYLYVFKDFRNIERIGLTDVDDFLKKYAEVITDEYDLNQRYQLCQMTGCVSLEALHRLHLAVYKKSRSRSRKEKLKKEQ